MDKQGSLCLINLAESPAWDVPLQDPSAQQAFET